MAMDDVMYRYALLDETDHPVSIDDIDRTFARQHRFYCPHCHNAMYAALGEVRQKHFRHNGDKCQRSKYLHDLAEHVFYEEYTNCLDNGLPFILELRVPTHCNKACVLKKHSDCKEHYTQKDIDLTKEYTLISLESRVSIEERYRRPDILLESPDGKQLWVEIWVSHETEEEKRKDAPIIEIKVDTEKDLEKIRKHKIVQSEGEDLSVRIFSIEIEDSDALVVTDKVDSGIIYPCEKFFCFEVGTFGYEDSIIDFIKTDISKDLYYRIILRLNWFGLHDSLGIVSGRQATVVELRQVCIQKYYSYGGDSSMWQNKSFDSLIVSEWKSTTIKPAPDPPLSNKPRSQPADASKVINDMEWIDLGLPSGVLWAKNDVDGEMTFKGAKMIYGVHIPSKKIAFELRKHCTREWDNITHAIVLTGPSGRSISFLCKQKYKRYWLNAQEKGHWGFGQCFCIGTDKSFYINEIEDDSFIFIRLVRYP